MKMIQENWSNDFVMGPKEVRKLCYKVITADTYDDDGFPIPMGLMDLYMGVIEPGLDVKLVGAKWMKILVTLDTSFGYASHTFRLFQDC